MYKFLSSGSFKDETKGHSAVQIDCDFLKVFGLLHCGGQPKDKATHFFAILQEGGVTKHQFISATDKDLEPIWNKVCGFATTELFTAAAQIGGIDEIYTKAEKASLEEQVEAFREDVFLEEVYGVASRLETEEWCEVIATKCNWCFNTVQIRKKMFELASIDEKHHDA